MAFLSTCAAAVVLALAQTSLASNSSCQSYGVDYQNGGSYFQNKDSNATFTAWQQFSGCSNDTAYNVIIDPNGDQSECSATELQPSGVNQLVTCSAWTNNDMYSGDWSILVVSNNDNDKPIAYQRDFYLSVGVPNATATASASTTTSTITTTTTSTSIIVATTSIGFSTTSTSASSNSASTSGSSASIPAGGRTTESNGEVIATSYYPVTATVTSCLTTSSSSSFSSPSHTPAEVSAFPTASAISPATPLAPIPATAPEEIAGGWDGPSDSFANTYPTCLGEPLDSMAASIINEVNGVKARSTAAPISAKFRRAIIDGKSLDEDVKAAFVQARAAFLHPEQGEVVKRHPDALTTTVYTASTTLTAFTTETATVITTTTSTSLAFNNRRRTASNETITTAIPYTVYVTACPSS